jgi:hypothetical protein
MGKPWICMLMFSGKDNKLLIAAELVEEKSVEDGILGS